MPLVADKVKHLVSALSAIWPWIPGIVLGGQNGVRSADQQFHRRQGTSHPRTETASDGPRRSSNELLQETFKFGRPRLGEYMEILRF